MKPGDKVRAVKPIYDDGLDVLLAKEGATLIVDAVLEKGSIHVAHEGELFSMYPGEYELVN